MKINKNISLKLVKGQSYRKIVHFGNITWELTKQNPNHKRKLNVNFQNKLVNKGNFNFIKIVGKGGFGRVWKVTQKKTKKTYALKVIDKARVITKRSVSSVMNEKQLLSKLQPDNNIFIVNMKLAFQDRQNLYLLMDFLDSGDLRYYLNKQYHFNEDQTKFIIRCIMEGLNYLHSKNIIHRDIKPQNIIFDKKGYCRITDLGIARYWRAQNAYQTSGTPGYMAPEVLMRKNHSFGADFYAVGVMAFQLLVGKRPYLGRDRKQIREQILSKQVKIPANFKNLSKQAIDFVNKMIQRDVRKRLGYNGITQIINHPWLAMKKQEHKNFMQQKMVSPIIPLEINLHYGVNDLTEPDEVWKQNILLLKNPKTQELFADYDYYPQQNRQKKLGEKRILTTYSNQNPNSTFLINLTTRQ